MVMGGYAFASALHISGPLAMVVAGIIIGNRGRELAMSDQTRDYLGKFWEIIDEILNALLFLLIGFEMLVISFSFGILWLGLISIGIVLLARFLSVLTPTLVLSLKRPFEKHSIVMLTWGGLRGGISVALALAIPPDMHRDVFVSITYIIVIFSILVQGLTIGKLAGRLKSQAT
jgi:CPA1 family monovalent cation:H+ antiporter